MKKLLYLIFLLPFLANAQVNTVLQKTVATGTVRSYSAGAAGTDTLAAVRLTGVINGQSLIYNSTTKKFHSTSLGIPNITGLQDSLNARNNVSSQSNALSFSGSSETLVGGGEINNIMQSNGTTVDQWYRLAGDSLIYYRTANNALLNNWGASTVCVGIQGLFPTVFQVGSTYYMFLNPTNYTTTKKVFLYSSTDKINWTILNSGNSVITNTPTGTDWFNTMYNTGVAVVDGVMHILIEGTASTGAYSGTAWLGYASAPLSNPNFTLSATPVFKGGNAFITYVPEKKSLAVLYGEIYPQYSGGLWRLRGATADLSASLNLSSSWVVSDTYWPEMGEVADPDIIFTPGKTHPSLITYNFNQTTGYQAYSDDVHDANSLYNSLTKLSANKRVSFTDLEIIQDGKSQKDGVSIQAKNASGTGSQPGYIWRDNAGVKKFSYYFDVATNTLNIGNSDNNSVQSIDQSGNIGNAGNIIAPTFIGALTGNASTATLSADATKLATARTINGVSFDGTANITVTATPTTGTAVSSITGTANQVIASASTGAITLSLPQSIGTTSTPTFGSTFIQGLLRVQEAGKADSYMQSATGFTNIISDGGIRLQANSVTGFELSASNVATVANLSGSGSRMVVAGPTGTLTTAAIPGGGGGSVTGVAVATANGLAGTSDGAAVVPTLTLTTTINSPLLAGNGTAISAATTTGTGSTAVLSASPALTGTPTAPTATAGTNTTQLATTAFVTAAITATGASSGTYTPTMTNTSFVGTPVVYTAHWIRIGNEVTVTGHLYITTTSTSQSLFELSLPVASNFTDAQNDLSAVVDGNYGAGSSNMNSVTCVAEVSNNTFSFATDNAPLSTNLGINFSITYTVK